MIMRAPQLSHGITTAMQLLILPLGAAFHSDASLAHHSLWGARQRRGSCSTEHNVRNFGAAGDGLSVDTLSIQAAIDAAGNDTATPQPCVVLEAGIFVSGMLLLRPHVTLYIDRTAILKASMDSGHFSRDSDWPYQTALVAGYSADGSAVAGGGVIDGQAAMFVTALDGPQDQFKFNTYGSIGRVRLVDFKHSRNVSVTGITLMDSTSFHLHFLNCSGVLAEGVTINADLRWPNNDGIDVTSCNNTMIRNCFVTTGDDAFSPKTWQRYGPLHNLSIIGCRFRARSGGIHFGASAWYDYVNVTIRDTIVMNAHGGLLVSVRGPGSIRGLTVTNLLISRTLFNAPCRPWMGNAQPIAVSADRWCGGPAPCDKDGESGAGVPAGTITGLRFENVTAQAENGIFVSGRVGGISDVEFRNVRLLIQQRPHNNGSFGPCPTHAYWPTSDPPGWYDERDLNVSGVLPPL
jgi:polygalacturonase